MSDQRVYSIWLGSRGNPMTAENPSQITGKKLSARRNRESLTTEQSAYLPSDTP